MKLKLFIPVLVGFIGLLFAGCMNIAGQDIYAAGYATSSDILDHDATLAPTIKDVAIKLPLLTTGGLTDFDLGTLRRELNTLESNTTFLKGIVAKDGTALSNAQAILAGFISSTQTANGGKVPSINTLAVMQFSQGLTNGIAYWQGKQPVPAATP
jgi:hypothetical protein